MTFSGISLQNLISISFALFILIFIFFIRPNNTWHYIAINEITLQHKIIIVFTLLISILVTVLPMPLSPYWNGTYKLWADKQQYARMADALIEGHLYTDNGDIDPRLEDMENPYDRDERDKLGVKYNWDEAYYNHHYYVYFGVVPTIILFIPYKLITGNALLSYQATQFFAMLTIIGLFYLFYVLCKNFFSKFPFSLYLILSSSFSILSIGYSISAPALYCTAIVSAVCFMVWSMNCLLKGAWIENDSNRKRSLYLVASAFLGALAFGCRPPAALANLIIIIISYQVCCDLNHSNLEKKGMILKLLLPYFFVGILLMFYNYARFDNVFEFGQSYQLTVADQHNYQNFTERFNIKELFLSLVKNFCDISTFSYSFPYIFFNGVFINYPILFFSIKIFNEVIANNLKEKKLYLFSVLLFILPFLITLFEAYWSPFLLERYRLDIYYLLCIVTFLTLAAWFEFIPQRKRRLLVFVLTILSFAVFAVEFLFFCIPYDGSYTDCFPEVLAEIYQGLRFGL